ncbi:hypothetical protein K1719_029046 [Acacia pycnantha]|nr:hypothetical protein K1719_029046 [Acacia pycnantha]
MAMSFVTDLETIQTLLSAPKNLSKPNKNGILHLSVFIVAELSRLTSNPLFFPPPPPPRTTSLKSCHLLPLTLLSI